MEGSSYLPRADGTRRRHWGYWCPMRAGVGFPTREGLAQEKGSLRRGAYIIGGLPQKEGSHRRETPIAGGAPTQEGGLHRGGIHKVGDCTGGAPSAHHGYPANCHITQEGSSRGKISQLFSLFYHLISCLYLPLDKLHLKP